MKLDLFEQSYLTRNLPKEEFLFGKKVLEDAQTIVCSGNDLDEISVATLDEIIKVFKEQKRSDVATFVALMRYFRLIKRHDLFIRLTQYTGGLGVIENIAKRAKELLGEQVDLLSWITIPPLGTTPEDLRYFTAEFVSLLKSKFDDKTIQMILAGNNHGLPKEAFQKEKAYYEEASSFKAYLKHLHERKIAELEQHLKNQTVWFEQQVTKEMIAFVQNNQEILSGVLEGDLLYQTKIPYDTNRYLQAKTKEEKAYYACHCPFARETLKRNNPEISPIWCYCSAGFEKFMFEVLFDQNLPVTCLNSVLNGDEYCRFAIDLSHVDYKR